MERILVIDDDQDCTRVLVKRWLPALGYHAFTATAPLAAEAVLAQPPLDLVLFDLDMVERTPIDVLVQIQQHRPNIPMILTAGPGSTAHVLQAFGLGFRDYLPKPYTLEQLQRALECALREQRLHRHNERLAAELQHIQVAHNEQLARIEHFLAGIGHTLNNSHASIAGYVQLLLRDPNLHDTVRNDLEQVLKQVQRASQVTQELLMIRQDLQTRL